MIFLLFLFQFLSISLLNFVTADYIESNILDDVTVLKTLSKYVSYIKPFRSHSVEETIVPNNSVIVIVNQGGLYVIDDNLAKQLNKEEFVEEDNDVNENNLKFPTRRIYYVHGVKPPKVKVLPGWTLKRTVEHMLRFHEIMNFLKSHRASTQYFFNEAQRIRRTGQAEDELRKMLFFLERSGPKSNVTKFVMHCYAEQRNATRKQPQLWVDKTNNLAVNFLRDPENDNTMN